MAFLLLLLGLSAITLFQLDAASLVYLNGIYIISLVHLLVVIVYLLVLWPLN